MAPGMIAIDRSRIGSYKWDEKRQAFGRVLLLRCYRYSNHSAAIELEQKWKPYLLDGYLRTQIYILNTIFILYMCHADIFIIATRFAALEHQDPPALFSKPSRGIFNSVLSQNCPLPRSLSKTTLTPLLSLLFVFIQFLKR